MLLFCDAIVCVIVCREC